MAAACQRWRGGLFWPPLPALAAPPAPALIRVDRVEHHTARQQAGQHADDLVADARNHQALAGHEARIAGLGDLARSPPEQPRGRRRVNAGTRLELGFHRTRAERRDAYAEWLDLAAERFGEREHVGLRC